MSCKAVDERLHNGVYCVVVNATCELCRGEKVLFIPEQGWLGWNNGELIQRAMPTLSAEDRELLISGTCGVCFDKIFNI